MLRSVLGIANLAIMKKITLIVLFLATGFCNLSLFSQTQAEVIALGLPGDNLNLYAVLNVFQDSKTLEEFERAINSRDSNINNLDLNNDNLVDYISVVSYDRGQFHSIVLRVAVSSRENQDVAVIEVSKNNSGKVIVQVIGDEALYGKNYIVEPSYSSNETPNPAYRGNKIVVERDCNYGNTVVYVDNWSIVGYLFSPLFTVYISPWHWNYYPVYYVPWTPLYYYNYWGIHYHYYGSPYFRRIAYMRYPSHYSYYNRRRVSSRIVERNRSSGSYNATYQGRAFKRPLSPVRRPSRQEIRRENRAPERQQIRPSTRQQNSESTRSQVQPAVRPNIQRSVREGNREPTREQVLPRTRQQIPRSTREESRRKVPPTSKRRGAQSVMPQSNSVRRVEEKPAPSLMRQTNRQIRQSARATRRSTRALRKKEQ